MVMNENTFQSPTLTPKESIVSITLPFFIIIIISFIFIFIILLI